MFINHSLFFFQTESKTPFTPCTPQLLHFNHFLNFDDNDVENRIKEMNTARKKRLEFYKEQQSYLHDERPVLQTNVQQMTNPILQTTSNRIETKRKKNQKKSKSERTREKKPAKK